MRTIPNNPFFEEIEQLILAGNDVEVRCKGTSMTPFLRDGIDIVVLSPCDKKELKKGEIVLFRYNGKYLLHRIIKVKENELIIQGDGICKNNEKVSQKDVIGLVRTIVRPNLKQVSIHNWRSRVYWHSWYLLRPARRYLLFIYSKMKFSENKVLNAFIY